MQITWKRTSRHKGRLTRILGSVSKETHFGRFHCCFAIPARKSPDTFDISDPSDDKELVFGRLYWIFRIELVSDMDIDGEPEERDLVLLKVPFLILFCYNFVHILYIFCIHMVKCIINFVYKYFVHILYTKLIQNKL